MAGELRIDNNNVLKKSGKPVIPAPMRMYILNGCHADNHVGSAKIYEVNGYDFTEKKNTLECRAVSIVR